MKLSAVTVVALLLAACSSPTQAPPVARPAARSWPGERPYAWPDSLPRYFPAEADVNPDHIKPGDTLQEVPFSRLTDCHGEYEFAAQCLAAFHAPVLQFDTTEPATYRFIWLRSFDRPVLLTLTGTRTGATLKAQFLNKSPGMSTYEIGLSGADTLELPPAGRKHNREFIRRQLADSAYMASYRAYIAFAKSPVLATTKKPVQLTLAQLQQFEHLLNHAGFWQLSGCQYSGTLDGAYWFLEAREPGRYHVVFRHSPGESEPFRQCGEYLLKLSAAKGEERY